MLYAATAAPSVATVFDDSLEFQVVLPTLGIAHPSGYPLYTLLGKLATSLLPVRDPAGRANLLSALAAAAATGMFYSLAVRLVHNRGAAAVATVAFAISPTWWSQATLAEVYTLHGLFVTLFLSLLVAWQEALLGSAGDAPGAARAGRLLALVALVAGLGMAHHRMIALLFPGAVVFVIWVDPGLLRSPRRWLRLLALAAAPLLLYLYLPLRGRSITSLDGTYRATWQGTLDWVLARAYGAFLTGNPFNVHRSAGSFLMLFLGQYGGILVLVALWGLVVGWRFDLRRYVLLLLATATSIAFAVAYRVEDVAVFFLPAFMLTGLWAALGLIDLMDAVAVRLAAAAGRAGLSSTARPWLLSGASLLLAALALFGPVRAALHTFPTQDRSAAWSVYDSGLDALDGVAPGGQVVGLLGETTLLRYFRDVLGMRADVALVAADAEPARLSALQEALARGVPAYLTRDLPGASGRYSLDAAGPLILVSPKATPTGAPPGREMGAGLRLLDAQAEFRRLHAGRAVRTRLTWAAARPVTDSLKVSVRLIMPGAEAAPLAAVDQIPVHFTYPTTAWVPGERVADVYDLALPPTTPAGHYSPLVILYRQADGSEVGRAQLPPIDVPGQEP